MAAKGVNKCIIVGNLGNEPDMRYAASGASIANITVATSESWKDKQSGEKKEKTEWHRVTFFGRLAEIVGEYLHKGSKVYIEGRLETNKWQDKEGNDRYTTSIIAKEMQMLDSKSSGAQNGDYATQGQQTRTGTPQSTREPPESAPFDDSQIPF